MRTKGKCRDQARTSHAKRESIRTGHYIASPLGSMAPLLHSGPAMKEICQNIKSHVSEVVEEWETLVREQPWYSLPAEHRISNLPEVIVGLVEAFCAIPWMREPTGRRSVLPWSMGSTAASRAFPST